MDSKSSNIIRIKSIDVSLMAIKYVQLYQENSHCWKRFGLEKTYPTNHFFNLYKNQEYNEYFKILDKEKFLWAMMICGVEFEFVKDFDLICNDLSSGNSFTTHCEAIVDPYLEH